MSAPVSRIRRVGAPGATAEEVHAAVQEAFNVQQPDDYWAATDIATRVVLRMRWRLINDYGSGKQYVAGIASAHGEFLLEAIIP